MPSCLTSQYSRSRPYASLPASRQRRPCFFSRRIHRYTAKNNRLNKQAVKQKKVPETGWQFQGHFCAYCHTPWNQGQEVWMPPQASKHIVSMTCPDLSRETLAHTRSLGWHEYRDIWPPACCLSHWLHGMAHAKVPIGYTNRPDDLPSCPHTKLKSLRLTRLHCNALHPRDHILGDTFG